MVVNVCFAVFAGAVLAFLSPPKTVAAANEIAGTDPCNSSNALVSLLLAERTRQQAETDARLAALESALEGNKIQTAVGPVVAFSARLSKTLDSFGFQQTLVFDSVITNIGAAYNGHTGIFTCPATGLYIFIVTILSRFVETELIAAGVSSTKQFAADVDHWGSSTQSVLLHLQKDSRVFVRHHLNIGNYVHGGTYSTFSGYLLRRL